MGTNGCGIGHCRTEIRRRVLGREIEVLDEATEAAWWLMLGVDVACWCWAVVQRVFT